MSSVTWFTLTHNVSINDVLVIQNAFKTDNMQFGLINASGDWLYKNFKVYSLEI